MHLVTFTEEILDGKHHFLCSVKYWQVENCSSWFLKKLSEIVDKSVHKKSEYNTDKQDLNQRVENVENKIPDVSKLVTNTAFNTKIEDVKNKIPEFSSLVTNTAFNTKIGEVENKIQDVNRLATDTDFNTKIGEGKNKNTRC